MHIFLSFFFHTGWQLNLHVNIYLSCSCVYQVVPRFMINEYATDDSDLCCGLCCCCKSAQVHLQSVEKNHLHLNLACLGKFDVESNETYEFVSGTFTDKQLIRDYVYGSVNARSTEIHAANHLVHGGLIEKLVIEEELNSLLVPSHQQMNR